MKQENKFVSYLIFLLALFILVLFAKNQYTDLQANLDAHTLYQSNLQTGRETLAQLNKVKSDLKQDSSQYDKYSVDVKENEILDYIYSNIETINSQSGVVNVKGITFTP